MFVDQKIPKTFASRISISCFTDALRDLVPFVQFNKPEKHPWRSVTFSKVAGFVQMVPIQNGFVQNSNAQRITIICDTFSNILDSSKMYVIFPS